MDLNQVKLTKSEWNSIEIPINEQEKYICDLIIQGYNYLDIIKNKSVSLVNFLKISINENIDKYLYNEYLSEYIVKLLNVLKNPVKIETIQNNKINIQKIDKMRIDNMNKKITSVKETIFEFILCNLISSLINKLKLYSNTINKIIIQEEILKIIVTLHKLTNLNVENMNIVFKKNLNLIINYIDKNLLNNEAYLNMLLYSNKILENNHLLINYKDETLYNHQKQLFEYIKIKEPKLIFYCAPTGTGKTLSPLGISNEYKLIFVCAARHVGLSFAKYAISCGKRIAFAFGCDDSSGIKLHNSSAVEFIKDRKSGGIFRIDNTNGSKVEIIICDIKSYLPAMYYMLAFEPNPSNIVLYWDEPTITLDYDRHIIHDQIQFNWINNKIPNIVLSSATLPRISELPNLVNFYKENFNGQIYEINTSDFNKSITVLNKENQIYLPHTIFKNYDELMENIDFCISNKTLMRYMDLEQISKFVFLLLEKNIILQDDFFNNCYTNLSEYNIKNIKLYYLNALKKLSKSDYQIINELISNNNSSYIYNSTIHITTTDAHTLKYGPTIFLTQDVDKIAKFYYKETNINDTIVSELESIIDFNNSLTNKINELDKELNSYLSTVSADKMETKFNNDKDVCFINAEIEKYKSLVKTISLPNIFIPNKPEHFEFWSRKTGINNSVTYNDVFCGNINERIVEEIMTLKIDNIWKVLLMMGIGVFKNYSNSKYLDIMKKLADEQSLYLIIADSDYIYGTNYQFCTGYLSKDMNNITYEKLIQALGRVGRHNNKQNYSIRFRDNDLCSSLFKKPTHKPEVIKMNELFNI